MTTPPTPSTTDATVALLRALVNQMKAAAHDPATVHLVAEKLHHGIDAVEKMLTTKEEDKPTKTS